TRFDCDWSSDVCSSDLVENEIFKKNPFATLDQTGVGKLMQIAVEKGRSSRPKIKLGICGEHGGDPESVKFCHRLGLDYVSCSPRSEERRVGIECRSWVG